MSDVVYVVYGTTESGDEWTLVFSARPTEEEIIAAIADDSWLNEEYEAECIQGWDIAKNVVIANG